MTCLMLMEDTAGLLKIFLVVSVWRYSNNRDKHRRRSLIPFVAHRLFSNLLVYVIFTTFLSRCEAVCNRVL